MKIKTTDVEGLAAELNLKAPKADPLFTGTATAPAIRASQDSAGTDVVGSDLTIASGRGTGNAVVTKVVFQTPTVTASGAGLQAMATRLSLDSRGAAIYGEVSASTVVTARGAFVQSNLHGAGLHAYMDVSGSDARFGSYNTSTPGHGSVALNGSQCRMLLSDVEKFLLTSTYTKVYGELATSGSFLVKGGFGNTNPHGTGHYSFVDVTGGESRFGAYNTATALFMPMHLNASEVRIDHATTASASNTFIDSAAANRIMRSTSSRRYKFGIENLEAHYADRILDLQAVFYRSKASADNQAWGWYGFIAEDVAPVLPQLVHWAYLDTDYEAVSGYAEVTTPTGLLDAKGKPLVRAERRPTPAQRTLKKGATLVPDGIQYERMIALLQDVVKRDHARIAELEADAKAKDDVIAALAARLDALEMRV